MTPTDCFGPQLARILQEQRRSGLMAMLRERQALETTRGGALWTGSRAARRRAAAAFVGEGVELCGCSERGCEACSTSERCACGKVSCAFSSVATTPVVARSASGAPKACLGPPPAVAGVAAPAVFWAPLVGANPPGAMEPHAVAQLSFEPNLLNDALEELTRTFAGTYFDTHSHNFMSTYQDWGNVMAGAALGTATYERIGWLASFASHDVGKMVISGMSDETSGADPVSDSVTANLITSYAAGLYPDFFVPFVQVLPEEIDASAASLVGAMLAAGFEGVGELIIHGHNTDINDNTNLFEIGRVAAAYGVPMQMHWEFGNVNNWADRTPEQNFDQLLAFLNSFPNVSVRGYTYSDPSGPIPLKVILCHCGAGPSWPQPPEVETPWKERMLYLLKTYENVYFDLAGMQVTTFGELYHGTDIYPIGAFLLDCIATYPTRFLLGYDTETRFYNDTGGRWGVSSYIKSIPHYEDFLGMESFNKVVLTEAQKLRVRSANAFEVLYTKPTPLAASVAATVRIGP